MIKTYLAMLSVLFALCSFSGGISEICSTIESSFAEVNQEPVQNPYKNQTETLYSWQYDVFEIFRGASTIAFDDTLEYKRNYSQWIKYSKTDLTDVLHEFECNISLPQYSGREPWSEGVNTYYQELMPQLIAEGDILWNENIDDHEMRYYIFEYSSAYQYENIITIIRSHLFGGWRPSTECNAFADVFSSLDGKRLYLDDLFCVDKEVYLPVLYSALENGTMCFKDGYNPKRNEDFRAYRAVEWFEDASFAAAPVGLVFIYPIGVASSTAAGVVFLHVPYEDLKEYLNPEYFPEQAMLKQ